MFLRPAVFLLSLLAVPVLPSAHAGTLACNVTIFVDAQYSGGSQVIGLGSTDMSRLSIGNDQLSSLRVPKGCTATLYADASFQGATLAVQSDTAYVGGAWNDRVSSIRVTRALPTPQAALPPLNDRAGQDARCWQPAYVACFATTSGISGAQGCEGNYVSCMTGGAAPTGCFHDAFTACYATTDGSDAGVIGCHGNYLLCIDGKY